MIKDLQTGVTVEMHERDEAVVEQTAREFLRIAENPENYIDKGGAGIVYRVPQMQHVCIKIMQNRHEKPHAHLLNLVNTPHQEALITEELTQFSHRGVRSPTYIGFINSSAHGFGAIVMEELAAVNLNHVLHGKQPVPPGFDADKFMGALEEYLDELQVTRGILHGDMADRNVMIDFETGLPRVIDFGRSLYISRIPQSERGDKVRADERRLAQLEAAMKAFFHY